MSGLSIRTQSVTPMSPESIAKTDAEIGVYSRPQAISSLASSAKERRMGSKPLNRRELLKSGAALAGGLTLGAAAPVLGQEPATHDPHAAPPMLKGDKDTIAYGVRSKYVTSVRISHPVGGRPSPDQFGLTFHIATPLQDSVGVITPSSLHYVATTRG